MLAVLRRARLLEDIKKGERRRILAAAIIGAISFMCANEIKEKIRKNRNSKDESEEGS